ncbi:PREDICTED: IQ domain-containing protein C [Sturnus vulgaris]|uniref:IQ domain-containing protein C n=1 Tax=Sturnus vulgaris TaxID=9172 RepID=UPI00071A4D92|nr:PREDICTED: IQ domain-containing protein C [Sturnus vulgaris]
MAAALGPRAGAEAEERRRLLRSVTRLQACARGFLLRRRLRGLREEFEAVVLEIEGDLRQLRWTGRVLQRPRFDPEPSPGKPLDAWEAAKDETIPKKTPEKPDPPGAERAGNFGNIPSSAPLPSGTTPKPPKPPNLGSGADKSLGKEGRALSQEWDNDSVTSEWDSSHLGASPEIPADLQGLSRSELQSHRRHLLMELLWIQQAIASRKHFLMLKQKLGIPNHSGIPEFLDWFGEALEQQHKS